MAPQQQKSHRYYIKTYGCQMNVADSAKLAAVLEAGGYSEFITDNDSSDIRELAACDLVLVNTCVVRQHAEDRAAGYIRSLSGLKQKNPNVKIGVCGCLVSEPGRDLKKMFPHVDLFVSPNSPEKLIEYLNINWTLEIGHWSLSKHGSTGTNYVSIMHGCNNFCSYCVVPYVRGREISRPMEEVLAEIKDLIEQGIKDITLLGQNVNSYKYGLADLMNKIHSFDIGHLTLVIRFMTSHPRDMSDEIIEAVHELPWVAKEFLLPLQSGDDEVLKQMNRGYTLAHYLDRMEKIRSLMPQARIMTDILVGFPGETEEQFENTLRAVEAIRFNEVHMFAYSDRPGTAAAKMPDKLPEEVKRERLQKLIAVVRGLMGVL